MSEIIPREVAERAVSDNPGHTSAELAVFNQLDHHRLACRLVELEGHTVRRGDRRVCAYRDEISNTWWPI